MRSKRRQEGYLLIDHAAAPGVPHGVPAGAVFESATVTCSHCHAIVVLNPDRTRAREYCSGCDRYICDGCAVVRRQTLTCRPLDAVLDGLQEQAAKERG